MHVVSTANYSFTHENRVLLSFRFEFGGDIYLKMCVYLAFQDSRYARRRFSDFEELFFPAKTGVFSPLPPFLFIKSMDLVDVVFWAQSKSLYQIYCVNMTKMGESDLRFATDLIFAN